MMGGFSMVGAEELESPTFATSMRRSSQLSYAPQLNRYNHSKKNRKVNGYTIYDMPESKLSPGANVRKTIQKG
jgi:hypothetical protein